MDNSFAPIIAPITVKTALYAISAMGISNFLALGIATAMARAKPNIINNPYIGISFPKTVKLEYSIVILIITPFKRK